MAEETAKGGNVILRGLDLPDMVMPGESVEAEIEISNGGNFIGPFDDDRCGGGGSMTSGYEIDAVLVHPDGSKQRSGTRCHGTTEIGTGDHTYTVTFTAPEETGDYQFQSFADLPGSGESTGRVSERLTVSDSAAQDPSDDDDDDDGNGNGGVPNWDDLFGGGGAVPTPGDGSGGDQSGGLFGGLFGGGGGLFENVQMVLVLVIVLVVLLVAAQSG